jgi:hypothetical protein
MGVYQRSARARRIGLRHFDQLAKDLIWLRTDHQIAIRHIRRHGGDLVLARQLELTFDLRAKATFLQRQPKVRGIQVQPVGHAGERLARADIHQFGEVTPVYRAAEVFSLALLVGPQRRLVCWDRVVPVGSFAVVEPLGACHLFEARARRRQTLRRPGDGLPLQRYPRMELKRAVLDFDIELLAQPVDPSLADITPRSNEVAEDDEPGSHALDQCTVRTVLRLDLPAT